MSEASRLPRDQVEVLRPEDVRHYLASRGWLAADDPSSRASTVYHKPSVGDAEVVLPTRTDLADYALRMAEVARTLAVVERRPIHNVLYDLAAPPADIVRLRVRSAEASSGHLPLDDALQLLRGGRDMLLSAACSVIRPQAFHPEKTLKQAGAFIKGCRVGQTERGSFVATIIAPVPPALSPPLEFPDDEDLQEQSQPFARRVTTRLMGSLDVVGRAIQEARLDPIFNGVDDGVSANLCEALNAMKPTGAGSNLDVSMSWSRQRPRMPAGVPSAVSFAERDFSILAEAGRRLRERAIPRRETFEGKVFSLQSDAGSLFDDLAGKIVLRTEVGGQPARVKVALGLDDYRRACNAHRDDRKVAVSGVVHHDVKVRVYELAEPRDFRVL